MLANQHMTIFVDSFRFVDDRDGVHPLFKKGIMYTHYLKFSPVERKKETAKCLVSKVQRERFVLIGISCRIISETI